MARMAFAVPAIPVLAAAFFLVASVVAVGSASAEPAPERKAELRYLLEQDCGSCHGLTFKGGLGSPLLPENVADRDDETLIAIILDGIPGTPMPPWRALIEPDEAAWLVSIIRKGPDR